MTRERLRNIVDDNTTKKGKIFDYVVQILIFISLVGYALETLSNLSTEFKLVLRWIEYICVILFFYRIFIADLCSKKSIEIYV